MHEFKFKGNQLYCEALKVKDIVLKFGTPLYIYSYKTLLDHYLKLKNAFREVRPLICYSVKANSNLSILKALVEKGAGLDIVSGGELFRAIKVGCPTNRLVYASVGKTEEEIGEAIEKAILFFNVESYPELENINQLAKKLKKTASVALRINPDIEPKTHKFIVTGKLTNKFGMDFNTVEMILKKRRDFPYLRIKGLHIHIGSQITEPGPFLSAIKKIVSFIENLKKEGINLEYLNIGGGLGIVYHKEIPQTAEEFAQRVVPLLEKTGLKIILEPGRFIAGPSGILVVKVLYIKETTLKKFIIVDGAMNDLIRPALYGAYHEIVPVRKLRLPFTPLEVSKSSSREKLLTGFTVYPSTSLRTSRLPKYNVVGPICESGDFFAKDRAMPEVKDGDCLAIMGTGAYGFSMASNYNSRRKPAEVMVKGNRVYLIRKRETYEDLIKNEVILDKF